MVSVSDHATTGELILWQDFQSDNFLRLVRSEVPDTILVWYNDQVEKLK